VSLLPKKEYELAKELNVSSKVLLDKLKKILKIDVKSHMTTLEDPDVDAVLRLFGLKKDEPEIIVPVKDETVANYEAKEEKVTHEKGGKHKNEKHETEKEISKKDPDVEKTEEHVHIEEDETENIKMNQADELLIEEYLNKENDKKIEKIGSKVK
jgi:translation initiation factor IF-2